MRSSFIFYFLLFASVIAAIMLYAIKQIFEPDPQVYALISARDMGRRVLYRNGSGFSILLNERGKLTVTQTANGKENTSVCSVNVFEGNEQTESLHNELLNIVNSENFSIYANAQKPAAKLSNSVKNVLEWKSREGENKLSVRYDDESQMPKPIIDLINRLRDITFSSKSFKERCNLLNIVQKDSL